MATPLHNHTHYSALDGLSKPEEIAEACIRVGHSSAACTDHGLVSGHLDFHEAMTDRGLKPLLGMEAYQALESRRNRERDGFHLLLLAETTEGLENLWALSSEAHGTGFYYKPRTDWELLAKYNEGIICTSACLGGLLSQSILKPELPQTEEILQRYLDIYGSRFYLEIHTYDSDEQRMVNQALVDLGKSYGIPLVYANDAHYAMKDQYDLHEGILKLTMNAGTKAAKEAGRDKVHPQCLYIMGEDEVRTRLEDHLTTTAVDEAIDSSDDIAQRVSYELPQTRKRTPIFVPDKGYKTNREMLLGLLEKGFKEKVTDWDVPGFPRDPKTYMERLSYETKVIFEADLVDYFLIVQDYVAYAKKHKVVVGPGRGSAGGSLVSYLLGITDVDPIHYDLLFERFYNPGREKGLPDIDIDFDMEGVEKVFRYVSEKYRPENVAKIGTITRMGPKAAFQAMGRVLKIPYEVLNDISKTLDKTVESGLWSEWKDILTYELSDTETVADHFAPHMKKYPLFFEWAEALMGKNYGDHHTGYVSTYSTHASAVIVADEPLERTLPLRWAAADKKLVTQWDMHRVEDLGFMKMDFLGLKQLTILDRADRIIKGQGKEVPDQAAIQYMEHPEELWEMFDFGLVTGIFQMAASATGRSLCKRVKPRSVDDLAFIVAVNRPGPLIAGSDRRYIEGKEGKEIEYVHPTVEKVTNKTFGEFIYQEQVIRYFMEIGYTIEEADDIRKFMGKKLREKMLAEEPHYLEVALQHMDEAKAKAIWENLVWFSKYAFNKSHAVQYGLIALWSAYYKYHYPAEYLLAGLLVDTEKKVPDRSKWIKEAMRMGIKVNPPDINTSGIESEIVDGEIMLGLTMIKGMGKMHSKWVVDNRPYTSYDQFQEKAQTIKYIAPNGKEKILMDAGRTRKLWEVGAFDALEARPFDKTTKIAIEEDLLTVALSDDSEQVLEEKRELIDQFCVPFTELENMGDHVVAGVIRDVTLRKTKKGDPMAFVTIQRGADELRFAVWQEGIKKFKHSLEIRTPIIAELRAKERGIELVKLQSLR